MALSSRSASSRRKPLSKIDQLRAKDLARLDVLYPELSTAEACEMLRARPEQVDEWRSAGLYKREIRGLIKSVDTDRAVLVRDFLASRAQQYAQELDRLALGARSEHVRYEAINLAMELLDMKPRPGETKAEAPQVMQLNQYITNLIQQRQPAVIEAPTVEAEFTHAADTE